MKRQESPASITIKKDAMEKEPLFIAFASQKGGVGKTAFTVLTAGILHYQRGYNVAVVDCDAPQHSITQMRGRDMERIRENDSLKVALYRQHEQLQKLAYPIIESDPEMRWPTSTAIGKNGAWSLTSCCSTFPVRFAA